MDFERFLKENLVKRQKPDFGQIEGQLKRADKDLKTAASLMSVDLTWAFAVAYHGMIRAGKALMYAKGCLPTTKNSHKTIVEFAGLALGDDYGDVVARFNRMRRKRHDFIYDSKNDITVEEARQAIETAKGLIKEIRAVVAAENPQKDVFGHER